VLGVKDLGLGLGFRLGLGSFALICRACTRNILLLAVYLQCALRTVNSVSNCTIYRARVAHGIQRYCVIHHACARRISPCINYIYIYIYNRMLNFISVSFCTAYIIVTFTVRARVTVRVSFGIRVRVKARV